MPKPYYKFILPIQIHAHTPNDEFDTLLDLHKEVSYLHINQAVDIPLLYAVTISFCVKCRCYISKKYFFCHNADFTREATKKFLH